MNTGLFSIYEPPTINSSCPPSSLSPPPPKKKKMGKRFLKTMAFAKVGGKQSVLSGIRK